ncbi:hypothetical protein [Stakelama tenebrarum]|uniref:Uncharacterized protein n=1 Tax=Stakelama tenebrarum TaxID=2711215 RepID=A0A6G6Y9F9_9SPHN|nr:hypothetical protein [Sphingosinithalassobacter tenebrarum]QIG81574.1 hypothetical protein G5C33_18465 [Sphingosinithalassobacter tenebrarum]
MPLRKTISAIAISLAAVTALSGTAVACMANAPFVVEDVRQADIVIDGVLTGYKVVSPGRPGTLDDYGLLTIRVDEALRGEVSGEVQIYWWNSTFAMPEKVKLGERVLVAAARANHAGLPLRGTSATVYGSRRPDLPQLLQAPCAPAFLLPYTPVAAQNIVTLLDGGTVAPHDYFAAGWLY